MIWISIAAGAAVIAFGFRLFRIKRQLRSITNQLNERIEGGTEKKMTVSLVDGDLNTLAGTINHSLDLQRELRIEVQRNDLQLKDSIANLSHDLRTPLTSIIGYMQLAQNLDCPPAKQGDYLRIVDDKAHTLKLMINNLYELSVLDIGGKPFKREELDLNLLLTDVLAGQYELFRNLGIDLKVDLPAYPIWISGNRTACTRIIQNLLDNTLHYAKEEAEVSLEKGNSHALLSIRNLAPNLTQEDTGHLLERFYTADKSRRDDGTGLGLYIVQALLGRMDGEIADVSLNHQVLCIRVKFRLSHPQPVDGRPLGVGGNIVRDESG